MIKLCIWSDIAEDEDQMHLISPLAEGETCHPDAHTKKLNLGGPHCINVLAGGDITTLSRTKFALLNSAMMYGCPARASVDSG